MTIQMMERGKTQPAAFMVARDRLMALSKLMTKRQRDLWATYDAAGGTPYAVVLRRSDELWDRSVAFQDLAKGLVYHQTLEELLRGLQYIVNASRASIVKTDARLAEGFKYDTGMWRIHRNTVNRRLRRTRAMMRMATRHLGGS